MSVKVLPTVVVLLTLKAIIILYTQSDADSGSIVLERIQGEVKQMVARDVVHSDVVDYISILIKEMEDELCQNNTTLTI